MICQTCRWHADEGHQGYAHTQEWTSWRGQKWAVHIRPCPGPGQCDCQHMDPGTLLNVKRLASTDPSGSER